MAILNTDYYDGKNIYNDGDEVEQNLLNHYKNNTDLNLYQDNFFYLTTDVRTNILNWYPFKKQDDVLELGCGCGTLTGMLCEKCHQVTSIEGSKRRAEITYYRHKDKKNLTVYAGNFDDVIIKEKFDYIILIGVFEYAKMFFKSNTPFDDFLEKIKNLLKDNGKVLIAIENRYGIKYWAGANEDHILLPYVGLEGYDSYKVQTFGKTEFINLIKKHGFTKNKFYYPFPDYKLPTVIYTDSRLPKEDEINSVPIYCYGSSVKFNIHNTLRGILSNDCFGFFSNSFLIEFGTSQAELSDIIYAKNVPYRSLKYKIITLENENHDFIKIADNNLSELHLEQLLLNHKKIRQMGIPTCKIEKKDNKYYMEKIDGMSVAEYILFLSQNNNWKSVEQEIDNLVEFYHSISTIKKFENPIIDDIKKVYKEKASILNIALIDGNVSNIRKNTKHEFVFIDQEWKADGELPTDYLIYYSLLYLFMENPYISNHLSIEHFYKKYHLTENKIQLFHKIENYYYTELYPVIDVEKKKILEGCKQVYNEEEIWNVLYFDDGTGFCDKNKIISKYQKNGNEYSVNFELPSHINRVRFDPMITGCEFINFYGIKINDKDISYEEYNINQFNNKKNLTFNHPYIIFPYHSRKLKISIQLEKFTNDELKAFIHEKEQMIEERKQLIQENQELIKKLERIENSRGWKMLEKIRKIRKTK